MSSLSLPEERHRLILDRLAEEGRVLATDLARRFDLSEDTIRRDLRDLAAAGLCRRVYGGALPLLPVTRTLQEREAEDSDRKAVLGQAAAVLVQSLMQPGQVLFLDAGSTNLAIARALPVGLDITVVTNAPSIAAVLLGRPGLEVVTIGGRIDPVVGAAVGGRAVREALDLNAHVAIMGACALNAGAGLAAFQADDAEFKRAIIAGAAQVVVAVTAEKLGTAGPFRVMAAEAVTHLILEGETPEASIAPLAALGIRLHRAVKQGTSGAAS